MKTLYLDCGMGAAGDMLTAALLELLPEEEQNSFISELNGIGIPEVKIKKEKTFKCGIKGTSISVTVGGIAEETQDMHKHTHAHTHSTMHRIEHIISDLKISEKIKREISGIYMLIAEAESHVHGSPVTDIHFHEVGSMDAVADIAAVCMLMERLSPEQITASPIHTGYGEVECAHGILPVPAPATAYLLRDIPFSGGKIKGELCTPTGAALLKHFVSSFGDMPEMRVETIGYGMGKKDFEAANCLRAFFGTADEKNKTEDNKASIYELTCNVDDMTAEEISFAMERIFENGALEVFTVPVGMKKSRPGTLISILCSKETRGKLLPVIFKYTTTIGIRQTECNRYLLDRSVTVKDTPYGKIRRKDSFGYGTKRSKYEYEDLAEIARKKDLGLRDAAETVEKYL